MKCRFLTSVAILVLSTGFASSEIILRATPHTVGQASNPQQPPAPPVVQRPASLSVSQGSVGNLNVTPVGVEEVRIFVSNDGDLPTEARPAPTVSGPFAVRNDQCTAPLAGSASCSFDIVGLATADGPLTGQLSIAGYAAPVSLAGVASGFAGSFPACSASTARGSTCTIDGIVVAKTTSAYLMRCDAGMKVETAECTDFSKRLALPYNAGVGQPTSTLTPTGSDGVWNTTRLMQSGFEFKAAAYCRSIGPQWYLAGYSELEFQMHDIGWDQWRPGGLLWSSAGVFNQPNVASSYAFNPGGQVAINQRNRTEELGIRCSRTR